MANIVRRDGGSALVQDSAAPRAGVLPVRTHHGDGIFVESQLSLGVEPTLHLAWAIVPSYWRKGFTLLVFRSSNGFSPEKHPEDLNRHGQLVIETTCDGRHTERPEEGSHYFTFLLQRRCFFGLVENIAMVRFSECVPSAKVGLGRIRDQIDLQAMLQKHEIDGIEHEARLNEAQLRLIQSRRRIKEAVEPSVPIKNRNDVIAHESEAVDVIMEAFVARREKLQAIRRDPKFKKLKPAERQAIIDAIEERLDPAEITARREMRGS